MNLVSMWHSLTMSVLTLGSVRLELSGIGMSIKHDHWTGEYTVYPKGTKAEDTGCYTNDLADALATGKAMVSAS